jgi:hypothetical protein
MGTVTGPVLLGAMANVVMWRKKCSGEKEGAMSELHAVTLLRTLICLPKLLEHNMAALCEPVMQNLFKPHFVTSRISDSSWAPVTHAYNPSYSGGREWEDGGSRLALAKGVHKKPSQ